MTDSPQASGWIKLWRSTKENGHLQMPDSAYKLWSYLLLQVNHVKRAGCEPGEGWITYQMIRDACCPPDPPRWNDHTISRALTHLENAGQIKRMKVKKGHAQRIRVINWDKYQSDSAALRAELRAEVMAEVMADKQECLRMHKKEEKRNTPPNPRQRVDNTHIDNEFEAWWSGYPHPPVDDKTRARNNYRTLRRKGIEAELLTQCRDNYAATRVGEDRQYHKKAANFLGKDGVWEGYGQPVALQNGSTTRLGRNHSRTAELDTYLEQLERGDQSGPQGSCPVD